MRKIIQNLIALLALFILAGFFVSIFTKERSLDHPAKKETKPAVTFFKEGTEFIKSGDYEKAVTAFKKSLEFAPQNKIIKESLSTVYVKIGGDCLEQRNYQLAEDALTEALKYNSNNLDAYIFLGDIRYYNQQLREAKEFWLKALSVNPRSELVTDRLSLLDKQYGVEKKFKKEAYWSFTVAFKNSLKMVDSYGMRDVLWNVYRQVGQDFGYFPESKIIILFYPHDEYMKMTGYGKAVRGHYDGKIRIPIVEDKAEMQAYKPAIQHEYTHAVVYALCPEGVPVWLNEGLALYEENKIKTLDLKLLKEALKNNSIIPLEQIETYLVSFGSPYKTELAYQEAFTMADYIINRYSLWHIKNILVKLSKHEKVFEEILEEELYLSLDRLNKDWLKYLEKKHR